MEAVDAVPDFPIDGPAWLELVNKLLETKGNLFPLPPLPMPPRPLGRSSRPRARFRRAMEVWLVAGRVQCALNRAGGVHVPVSEPQELPCARLGMAGMSPLHEETWRGLLVDCARLARARRGSLAEFPTGASLWSGPTKRCDDMYSLKGEESRYVS